MLDEQDPTNRDAKGLPFTVSLHHMFPSVESCRVSDTLQVRTVFVIDPKKVIRLTISYPASTGRNFDEILRSVFFPDALCDCLVLTSYFSGSSTVCLVLIMVPLLLIARHRDIHIALQLGDKYRVTTPVNWKKGDDVIVHPSVSNDEAKTLFPDVTFHKV